MLKEFRNNLEIIHKKLDDIGAEMVLLTMTPIINEWHSWKVEAKCKDAGGVDNYLEFYRQATREFAKQKNLILIDLDLVLRKACEVLSPEEMILKDGVHLTVKANEIVAETIFNHLSLLHNSALAKLTSE